MSDIRPIENDHSGEWHAEKFVEFARAKAVIGEPVPHMRVVDYLCAGCSVEESMWRAGVYLAAYSVIAGEGVWNSWSWDRYWASGETEFSHWIRDNWAGMHTRKPRRMVRNWVPFSECVDSFAEWIRTDFPRLRERSAPGGYWATRREAAMQAGKQTAVDQQLAAVNQEEYDEWWKSGETIRYFGRYITIRLLELCRRRGHTSADLYDIRAVGAHSPIRCLMLLRPGAVDELMTGAREPVDRIAAEVKVDLAQRGVDMSHFLFATLLCEYRSCYEGGSDYAGNQHDEELEGSLSRYARHWESTGMKSRLYEARAAIDPHECLGELQGWQKRRTDVAGWMRSRGIVWSDLKWDYNKSVAADEPVER